MQRSIKAIIISVVSILIIGVGGLTVWSLEKPSEASKQPQNAIVTPQPPTIAELLKLVNEERAKVGVVPLTLDSRLNTSAQRKADDMVKYNYFGHISPNDHEHGYEYINDVGIYCKTDSENLVGANNSQEAIDAWDNSAPHYKALTNTEYTLTGFGFAHVKDIPISSIVATEPVHADIIDSYVIVEHFCQQ